MAISANITVLFNPWKVKIGLIINVWGLILLIWFQGSLIVGLLSYHKTVRLWVRTNCWINVHKHNNMGCKGLFSDFVPIGWKSEQFKDVKSLHWND